MMRFNNTEEDISINLNYLKNNYSKETIFTWGSKHICFK